MTDITTRARALLAAATPGPFSVYPLTRAGRGFGVGRETPPDHKEGICEDPFMLAEDAELFAFAVSNIGTLCDALEVAEAERDALRAEVERLRARVDAVGRVLSENGCDCDCGCFWDEHGDDCDRCLACRADDAIARREDVVVEGGK